MRYNIAKLERIARRILVALKNNYIQDFLKSFEDSHITQVNEFNLTGEQQLKTKDHELYELEYTDDMTDINFILILRVQTDYESDESIGNIELYVSPDKKNIYSQQQFKQMSNSEVQKLKKEIKELTEEQNKADLSEKMTIQGEIDRKTAEINKYGIINEYIKQYNESIIPMHSKSNKQYEEEYGK